jgi:hypothetical protein
MIPLPLSIGRRRPLLAACGLALTLVCACEPNDEEPMISRSDLENVKVGEVVTLKPLLKKPAESVCVLHPHQESLSETKGPLAAKVNAQLAKKHYVDDDPLWALVFVDGGTVTVQVFDTPEKLSLCRGSRNLSKEVREVECTAASDARVTKAYRFGGPCLVFGEARSPVRALGNFGDSGK